ncbi:MAG: hypothetical protein Ct9H300mP1_19670 [Planctomycetaceae bacterium]|nr:MAG: hypothetical protein Ct9H300mP1_19670 [Planctomycetaceae bacterium]
MNIVREELCIDVAAGVAESTPMTEPAELTNV